MNRTQAMIAFFRSGDSIEIQRAVEFTDITDAHCMLAVVGPATPGVMEHVSNLDLFNPSRKMPFLTQGPIMHIPCQVVTLSEECVLISFSRGYGQSFADAILHAASGCDLRPGGEGVFNRWSLQKLS
jgi:glycine cleavage system aminomethyltransferase T